jgi:hypothetical protein
MSKITLAQQIAAMELQYVNSRGTLAILKDNIAKKRADPASLPSKESHLLDLEAVLKTLKWLAANEDKIKSALKSSS